MRTKRDSIEPKSRLPVSAAMRQERRKSSIGKVVSKPVPSISNGKKDSLPPRKKINYFDYINDFLKANNKTPPFPNRVRSYNEPNFAKAASDLLSLIDCNFKEINRNGLDRQFNDILDVVGYPYNVRQFYHQPLSTDRNFVNTIDPLRWLSAIIMTHQQVSSMPPEEKMYDEESKEKLRLLDVFIHAHRLWLQGEDEEVENVMQSVFCDGSQKEEEDNQMLQNQFDELKRQLGLINSSIDNSLENKIQQLEIQLQEKEKELSEIGKQRDELNQVIDMMSRKNQALTDELADLKQKESDLNAQASKLPYNRQNISDLIKNAEAINVQIDEKRNAIEDMNKLIAEEDVYFKTQLSAMAQLSNDLGEVLTQLHIDNPIVINEKGQTSDELFGTNIDELVELVMSKKPNIQEIENENDQITQERKEVQNKIEELKKEEERLQIELESSKDPSGKDIGKLNKRLTELQNKNKQLAHEVDNGSETVKANLSRLDDKFKSVTDHISSRLAEYLNELRKVQEDM